MNTGSRKKYKTFPFFPTVPVYFLLRSYYISYNFRSLVKRVNVGLSVQPIEDEMVEEIMVQGGSVSPIVTIEPRRRKFHKAITVSVPLPERISSAYLRKKQEINKNDRTIAPKKMPIGKSFLNFLIEKLKSTFKARVYL